MARLAQRAFSGGEVAEDLFARVDIEQYAIALKTAYNVILHRQGGASGRAGTQYVCTVSDSGYPHALTPFNFNGEQAYVNVWGHENVRIVMDGAEVLEVSKNVVSITQAAQGVVEITAHGWANGDKIYSTGIGGMTALNARHYIVSDVATDTFKLKDLYGNYIDTSALPAFTSGGVFAKVHTVASPYTSNANINSSSNRVYLMDWEQSNDEMFVAHVDLGPRKLTRSGHAAWTLTAQTFGATIAAPANITVTAPVGTGAINYSYTVTALNDATGEESVAGTSDAITNDLSADATYKNNIVWDAVAGATRYNVYRDDGGIMGLIGGTTGLTFDDVNYTPDLALTPPINYNPFNGAGNLPGAVTLHEARLVYGRTKNQPGAVWASRPVQFGNFNYSIPQRSDDMVSARLLPGVNAIQGMVSLGRSLACFTAEREFTVSGGGVTDYLTPTSSTANWWTAYGAGRLKPLRVGRYALFATKQGRNIMIFGADSNTPGASGFDTQDLTLLAPHLFEGHFIRSWCYQQDPHGIVWMVRDDGILLALTLIASRDAPVFGFSRVELGGDAIVESVTCIPGATEDEVYFETRRTINGGVRRHVERLKSLLWGTTLADYWGLDDALFYSGAAISTVTGLHHLEGETVAALADGFLVTGLVVTNGAVTLPSASFPDGATKILVGYQPPAPEISPLPVLGADSSGRLEGKRKRFTGVALKLIRSCGVYAGPTESSVYELKLRASNAPINQPTAPYSGTQHVTFTPKAPADGTFIVRGTGGLPFKLTGLFPDILPFEANQSVAVE